jgi:hypothetical protein
VRSDSFRRPIAEKVPCKLKTPRGKALYNSLRNSAASLRLACVL